MAATATHASPHLSWAELACKDGTPYPERWRDERGVPLALEFERIREAMGGRPLNILSAYRTRSYNARVPGAAKNSQHVEGRAIDIETPEWAGPDDDLVNAVVRASKQPGSRIRGIGVYSWGVHVDIRPGDKMTRWYGSKPVQVAPEV